MSKLMIFLLGILVGELLIILTNKFKHIRDEVELEKTMKDALEEEEIEIL